MNYFLYITVFLIILILISLGWKYFSQFYSLPHPAWLGFLVNIDNPFLKEHGAKRIISHLELQPNMNVLDFGCGVGRVSIPLAQMLQEGGTLSAYDIQASMLKKVTQKASKFGITNIETILGSAEMTRLPEEYFDRIVLVTVLGEVVDKHALFSTLYQALKPDGFISITEVISDPHFQTTSTVLRLCEEAGFKEHALYGNRFNYTLLIKKK